MTADLLITNARVTTLDPSCPTAEAVAILAGRIQAVGTWGDLQHLKGPRTEVLDAAGGIAVPAFHDAHLHLLSYARARRHLDCRDVDSIASLQTLLAARATALPTGAWVRAIRYDELALRERRHPDRHDLDTAVPDRPVRLQHRSLHLEVLNTPALRMTGLIAEQRPEIERDPASGEPTGRIYQAGEVLRGRIRHATADETAEDVDAATRQLLSWGITSVQDASVTNGVEEWSLFRNLARGALHVRVFMMPGSSYWQDVVAAAAGLTPSLTLPPQGGGDEIEPPPPLRGRVGEGGDTRPRIHLGPVKFMLDERTTDPAELRAGVAAAWRAGHAVALHAVSEAEIAIALEVLRGAPAGLKPGPNRIEHAAVLPDALMEDLRASGAMVVGQPALVYDRGDVYLRGYEAEHHGWLHRARSLLAAGIPYAAGSDAPVTDPRPGPGFVAARRRTTRRGELLGVDEALSEHQALAALTLGPARAVGAAHELGQLRPGAVADIAILGATALDAADLQAWEGAVRFTIMEGQVVWERR